MTPLYQDPWFTFPRYSVISRITRHGFPAANTPSAMSLVTTLPAPMTVFEPIFTASSLFRFASDLPPPPRRQLPGNLTSIPYLGATASSRSISSFVGGAAVVAPGGTGTRQRCRTRRCRRS